MLSAKGKHIISTDTGRKTVDLLSKHIPKIIDPVETANLEDQLEEVRNGKLKRAAILGNLGQELNSYVVEVNDAIKDAESAEITKLSVNSWHEEHRDEPIAQTQSHWIVPGYGKFSRVVAQRKMSLDEYKAVTWGDELLMTFTSKKNKPFEATLAYSEKTQAIKFVFPEEASEETGIASSRFGKLNDNGQYFVPEKLKCRIYKNSFGRNFTAEEVVSIMDSPEGQKFDDCVSAKGKVYSGKIVFNDKAKPFPKLKIEFN